MTINLSTILADAIRQQESGASAAAERRYRLILAVDPGQADVHNLLGVLAYQYGGGGQALGHLARAIRVDRSAPGYHANLAIVLHGLGRHSESAQSGRSALTLQPSYAEPWSNLGLAMWELGNSSGAIAPYRRALRLRPEFAAAHNNLGLALWQLGDGEAAAHACKSALVLRPDFPDAFSNLGLSLQLLGQMDAAATCFERAMAIRPGYAEAFSNMANLIQEGGRWDEAEQFYRRAIGQRPDHAEAHSNLGILLLRTGRFTEGWREFEWRWGVEPLKFQRRDYGVAQWMGDDLAGRTILLHVEQGMGDALQFCRYVPQVAARGGRVILEVHRPLVRFLHGLAGVERIIAKGDPIPRIDLHCALQSLPLRFGTEMDTIPGECPYLAADSARVEAWRARLPKSGLRVGIVWQGSPAYNGDRTRSAPLRLFSPLSAVPGVTLISLQKRDGLEQLADLPSGMTVTTLDHGFDEGPDAFIDSAAVIMNLDLVITVDTAIGHLAGALGKPVWLALSLVAHWPWMLDREDSPWYPRTRLFRQSAMGDWEEVFERMARCLQKWGSGQ